MSEDTIQVFIDGVIRYFTHTSDKKVQVGTPYLADKESMPALDMTGIIGVSGPNRGCVYFSAPRILLKHLLLSIGEAQTNEDNMVDLVGEVANTIAGNARSILGETFMISIPIVVEGQPSAIHLPKNTRSYIIPITWKSYTAAIAICLSET
ncbi:chemotaxis protein CheX [Reinekea sp.]|jgi:chemotaxis protein CheX|uniref:chemotaxis protein CheX n=1 Tax=Reinekea sp. TaxID=1970455 RepID=UPI002A7FC795|nr:chemotaxis protein CheX [Reinekea sp.]